LLHKTVQSVPISEIMFCFVCLCGYTYSSAEFPGEIGRISANDAFEAKNEVFKFFANIF